MKSRFNPRNIFAVFFIVSVLLGGLGQRAALAESKMYFTDSVFPGYIKCANLDGSGFEILITDAGNVWGLAVDLSGGKMYWSDTRFSSIRRANLDGTNVEMLVTTFRGRPLGLALDLTNDKMYWVDAATQKIQRADLDGSNIEDLVTFGLIYPVSIALDVPDGKMYWTDYLGCEIQRADLDGSNVQYIIISELYYPGSIFLDLYGGKIYWEETDLETIRRADLDGSNAEYLITGLGEAGGIALSEGKMYWTNWSAGKIQRANLDGSNVEDILTGLGKPCVIVIPESEPRIPKTYYVDCDATGTNDGSNWINAFNYLQDALAAARYSDQILVAEGTYKPDSDTFYPDGTGDRQATFKLKNGVALKGGYAGFGEPDPNARDIILYETVLSGDLNGNDTEIAEPCDLLADVNRSENSYTVVTATATFSNSVLDGFIIERGNANGTLSNPTGTGGGMYSSSSEMIISSCVFRNNTAVRGGGIYNKNADPTLVNCIFTCNVSSNHGAGLRNEDSGSILMNCCLINNWAANEGGGMYNYNWPGSKPVKLINCTIAGNHGNSGQAGGVFHNGEKLQIVNSILWANTAKNGTIENQQIIGFGLQPDLNYNCIQGWTGDLAGTGNIDLDPYFADPCSGDYHLLPDSPCIDTGDPNYILEPNETDLDGNPRIINDIIDMGAYEFQQLNPFELLLDLSDQVIDLNLPKGTSNNLLSKLDNALKLLEDENENNDKAAINLLQAFINTVEAQSGKKIPTEDANALITAAQQIIDLLSNQ